MRNDQFLVFLFGILAVILVLIMPQEEMHKISSEKQTPGGFEKENRQFVVVRYEIKYGSIYTGDQTAIVYKGIRNIPILEGGIGANGLPVHHLFPISAQLHFFLKRGEKVILHVPCMYKDEEILSWLEIKGITNRIFMKTLVTKENGFVFVKATTLLTDS
jgi:hypothetical protein